MKLREWINKEKLYKDVLNSNPNSIRYIQEFDIIDIYMLSGNKNGIEILRKNKDKIDWYLLSYNPNGIELLHLCTFKMPIFYILYSLYFLTLFFLI